MVVKWSSSAEEDLKGIFDYYKVVAGLKVATGIAVDIHDGADSLAKMPLMAPVEKLLSHRPERFRSLVVKRRYKVVYFVDSEAVNVMAICDCKQAPETIVKKIYN